MTSEVKADLKIELSDLNYLCSHPSLASKCFPEMIHTDNGQRANYDPLTCVASQQVKTKTIRGRLGLGRYNYVMYHDYEQDDVRARRETRADSRATSVLIGNWSY